MIALLDTHSLLWALGEPSRLGRSARGVITDTDNELRVSAATAWELTPSTDSDDCRKPASSLSPTTATHAIRRVFR